MNREQAKEFLPIITAYAEGKTIQINDYYGWHDMPDPVFNNLPEYYRIKPEPKEIWVDLKCLAFYTYKAHPSLIKFREVVDK